MHPLWNAKFAEKESRYCPREGYKVASIEAAMDVMDVQVTVPVRGIRLHLKTVCEFIATFKLLLSP